MCGVPMLPAQAGAIAMRARPAASSAERTLTARQVTQIVKLTGYQGLRSHTFDIADKFARGQAEVVVVQLDAARLAVPLTVVQRDIALAESLASGNPTFVAKLKVGPGAKQDIKYDVDPAGVLAPQKPYRHYIIFTPNREGLAKLTAPVKPVSDEALTTNNGSKRVNVTLLHDLPPSTPWATAVSAPDFYAMVECINTSSLVYVPARTLDRLAKQHVNMSYMTDPNHRRPSAYVELQNLIGRGREIWSNSMGFAINAARAGVEYDEYVKRAKRLRFSFYPKNDMRFLTASATEYRRFAAQ